MNNPLRRGSVLAGLPLLVAAAALMPVAAAQPRGSALLVKAGRVIPVEGAAIEKGEVLMRGGLIQAVGKSLDVPSGTKVLSFPDGIVFPGFIDGGSYLGVYRNRDETTRPLVPDLLVEDTFNPFHASLKAPLRGGITTMHLIPGDQAVVGGE